MINIKPGEYYLGPYIDEDIVTVLGSCISVIMWHQASQRCAMSHYVVLNTIKEDDDEIGRYGQRILPHFVDYFDRHHCAHEDICVSVYGGSVSLLASGLNATYQVGSKNTQYALDYLRENGFEIIDADVGGNRGRKLKYLPMKNICELYTLPALTDL